MGEEGLFSSRIIETKTGGRLLGYAQEPRHDELQDASDCDEGWLDLDSAARLPVNRSFMRSLTWNDRGKHLIFITALRAKASRNPLLTIVQHSPDPHSEAELEDGVLLLKRSLPGHEQSATGTGFRDP